jgi:membrane fusion protein (multidrug efflux system)
MSNAPTLNEAPIAELRPVGRRPQRAILLIVVPLIAALAATVVYLEGGRQVETDNAYIKADKVPVSANVSGTIKEVMVAENQSVLAGQPLFRIDPASFEVEVARAEAKLAQVRTDLDALRASYREKQAEIALERTRYGFALKDQERQADLVTRHFISAARFDAAKQSSTLASQQIIALEQDLKRIAETLGGGVNVPIEIHPSYRAALAALEQAKLDLVRSTVCAPLPGTVSKLPKPGQYITAGNTALALVVNGNLWIEANFPETDLTYVHPGEPVVIHVDTYPDAAWKGMVESLSPATGAEFSVIPAQNATGNWVKIAQRVPVKVKLEAAPGSPQLRAGLSAVVKIDTGHRRQLLGFSL